MQPRLSLLTIAVSNLSRTRAFYERHFGWEPVAANEDIVFFQLNGMLLSFYPSPDLARDAGLGEQRVPHSGFTLAYNVDTPAEVDEIFERLERGGVAIIKRPEPTWFGAYQGTFADVEGNVWEVAANPYVVLDEHGHVVGHRSIQDLRPPAPSPSESE